MIKTIKFLIVLISLFIIGCGAKSSNYGAEVSYSPPAVIYSESAPIPRATKRIITKRANISVEVDTIEKAKEKLIALIEKQGGFITNANTYENRYSASAKVPSDKLMNTLNAIATLGDKISQSISQNDVTNQFVDNEARLKNLILFRDKMKKLLNQTTNIEEIVKIEKELRRVQIEIDSIQGQLKYLRNAVALSPININFKEKTVYGPLGYIFNGVWWVTKKLFVIK